LRNSASFWLLLQELEVKAIPIQAWRGSEGSRRW